MRKQEAAPEFLHRAVLLDEAVDALDINGIRADGIYIDGTFGRGGHSQKILARLGAKGRLIAFDKDPVAIASAEHIKDPRFNIVHDSFANLHDTLTKLDILHVDGVLLDLGISSPQIDDATRGFSFRNDGPLDMRMDTTRGVSAAHWLAIASAEDIKTVIRDYGEERFAAQIAKAIVATRTDNPINSTRQLANIVDLAVKTREKGKDPATRTFQAIRIHINQELDDLTLGLERAFAHLAVQGRLVVISFHSLEDRIVKQFMASKAKAAQPHRRLPIRSIDLPEPDMQLIARIKPTDAEVAANPRARSAILRVATRKSHAPRSAT